MEEYEKLKSYALESVDLVISDTPLLTNVNISLDRSGINCLLGPNGSGKSLTNKILALILDPKNGGIKINGVNLNNITDNEKVPLRRKIGYMTQKPIFFKKNLFQNIEIPLIIREVNREERKKKILSFLKDFELTKYSDSSPYKLSIGEQQKVSFLRTIIYDPQILILDEPTSSLDPSHTLWFENYLKESIMSDKIILITTHDQFQVKRIADYVHFMINTTIVESGSKELLNSSTNKQVRKYLTGELDF